MDNNLYSVLDSYGFKQPFVIKQIDEKRVWQINDNYILKKNDNEEKDIKKALMINNTLKDENIPVAEYIKTVSGEYYTVVDGNIYSLMRKMPGEHIEYTNPLVGDYKSTAHSSGVEIAKLHKALKKLGNTAVYESNLMDELRTQVAHIKNNNIDVPCEILNSCFEFDKVYHSLPKQVIHRDIQFGNMLFKKGRLNCFLDFDSSQVNIRIFDIVYFGQSVLFNNNYKDSVFITQWGEFFKLLLNGYHSENILYKNEIKAIYKLCLVLQLSFISFYLYTEEKRKFISSRIEMAKWIYSNEQIFTFSLSLT